MLVAGRLCPAAESASRPLAIEQGAYVAKAGESVQISASQETLDFLLKAKKVQVQLDDGKATAVVAGHNRTKTQMMFAVPAQTKEGTYQAKVTATSAAGEARTTTIAMTVKPRQAVPTGSTRPPVVLLNGWETGFTGECPISTSSSETFGNLASYLIDDGVPVVYLFDNCAVDPNETIETLGNDLATYLNTIKDSNGDQVEQIDLVGFSMGGLIARSYLAGLQPSDVATPPTPTLVRDLILIATPNFGSFVAGNYGTTLLSEPGTQDAEMVPGSSFLWNLATWNQRGDDLRGVNALAIIGNAAPYLASLEATAQQNNASDGLVSETSASLGFALPDSTPTQVVPYCHVDPSVFTNTLFGTFNCDAAGIANVTSTTQETGEIVRSFLSGTTDWKSIGTAASKDAWLSIDGGIFFGMQSQTGTYAQDITSVAWGTVALTNGGRRGHYLLRGFRIGHRRFRGGQYFAGNDQLRHAGAGDRILCGGAVQDRHRHIFGGTAEQRAGAYGNLRWVDHDNGQRFPDAVQQLPSLCHAGERDDADGVDGDVLDQYSDYGDAAFYVHRIGDDFGFSRAGDGCDHDYGGRGDFESRVGGNTREPAIRVYGGRLGSLGAIGTDYEQWYGDAVLDRGFESIVADVVVDIGDGAFYAFGFGVARVNDGWDLQRDSDDHGFGRNR